VVCVAGDGFRGNIDAVCATDEHSLKQVVSG